jgi:hypothetical protein
MKAGIGSRSENRKGRQAMGWDWGTEQKVEVERELGINGTKD